MGDLKSFRSRELDLDNAGSWPAFDNQMPAQGPIEKIQRPI